MLLSTEQKLLKIRKGKITAAENIKGVLNVIRKNNSSINAILHVNNNAVAEAEAVDKKRKAGKAGKLAARCACIARSGIAA